MDDAAIAAGIQRVINFVRGATIDFPELPPEVMPSWVSNEVNQFDNSAYDESNAEIGYAAVDNAYLQTRYELDPDQALVMRGASRAAASRTWCCGTTACRRHPYRYRRLAESQPGSLREGRQLRDRGRPPRPGRAELDRRGGAAHRDDLLALPAARGAGPAGRETEVVDVL